MISLSFLIFSLFIVGCSHEQPHNEALTEAEKIVYTQPDKVVRMLAPHYNDTTMTKTDRALYGLIYTEALHHSGLSTGSDSLIRLSRDYYERQGDKPHLARALLHHAIILYKNQLTHEAILTMKRAELMAEDWQEPAFRWYLYSVLGDVNDNVGNYSQTLRYYKQALGEARECDNTQWIVQTLNNIGMTFDMIGQKDSLKYYISQAKPLVSKTDGEVRATYLVNNASYLLSKGKQQEAKHNLLESLSYSSIDRASKLLADIYVQEGDTEAAAQQWYRLTNSFSPDVAIESYRLLIEYLNSRGYKESALEYSQRLNEVYHCLYERNDVAGIIDLQTQYDEQLKERKQYKTTIMLLSAIIVLILIAAIIIRYSRQIKTELTKMRRQNERERRENSHQMKEVVSSLHASANKGQAATDEDANNLAQISFSQNPELRELLSNLNSKEQLVCLLTIQNFLPTEIATLTISTPQTITNTRVRLLKKLFNETGGAKDFDNAIKRYNKN